MSRRYHGKKYHNARKFNIINYTKGLIHKISNWFYYQPYWFKWCLMIVLYMIGIYLILNCFIGWMGATASVWMAKYLFGKAMPWWIDIYIAILSILSFILGLITIGIARGIQKKI